MRPSTLALILAPWLAGACTDPGADDPSEDAARRVTLAYGFAGPEIGVDLASGVAQELPPNSAGGRDHGNVDLGVAVAQVLSLGSIRGSGDDSPMLCSRGSFASIDDIDDDDDGCEWTPRLYLGANTGDTAFLDALPGTGLLATNGDGASLFRLWLVGGTFADNRFTLTLDLDRLE